MKSVWCRQPGTLLLNPSIIVLDAFRCHLVDSLKRLLLNSGSELVTTLGGMMSQLQPLAVCIKKPFKDTVKQCYTEWLHSGEPEVTSIKQLKWASPAMQADSGRKGEHPIKPCASCFQDMRHIECTKWQ